MIAPSSIEWVASGLARVLLNEDGLLVISGRQDYTADEISEGWRCGGLAPLWWVCPSCAAVDDAIERDVDDAIDRSAS